MIFILFYFYNSTAKDELGKMLCDDQLRDAILLVFANKQDFPNAMKVNLIFFLFIDIIFVLHFILITFNC